ncbi:MoxR-like ATPase [Bacillus sp. JCM 19046]|nr:MoxR-like ATPase [Bacillus sp. JCM 19045]GAF17712.1 MoxR-like ATPase [Bacillus sp. JCM 19046]
MDHTIQTLASLIKQSINQVIIGKDDVIDSLLVGLFSSGHVLLDDVPGTGKTLLVKTLSASLGIAFKRIQFTPDLLPTDITGLHFFNQKKGDFQFRPGPIFTNLLLADEINRATPRTQSSLLESMEERQVSIDGETHLLDSPFMVVATQNPVESQGTFPLPEAQLDRFLLKTSMGYPSEAEGVKILKRFKDDNPLQSVRPVATYEDILKAQQTYSSTYVSDDILSYIVKIVEHTRNHSSLALGVSPRGSQALLKASQVYASMQGRSYVAPDDVKHFAKPVLSHRIVSNYLYHEEKTNETIIDEIIQGIEIPTEDGLYASGDRSK